MNLRTLGLMLVVLTGLVACGGGGLGTNAANNNTNTTGNTTITGIVGTWGNADETDTFNSDKTYVMSLGGCTYTGGTYSVSGNNLTFDTPPTAATPTPSCDPASISSSGGGIFPYTISGNSLTYGDSSSSITIYALVGKWSGTTETYTYNTNNTYVVAHTDPNIGTCTFTGGTYTASGETLTLLKAPTAGAGSSSSVGCDFTVLGGLANSSTVISITSATSMTSTDNITTSTFTRI